MVATRAMSTRKPRSASVARRAGKVTSKAGTGTKDREDIKAIAMIIRKERGEIRKEREEIRKEREEMAMRITKEREEMAMGIRKEQEALAMGIRKEREEIRKEQEEIREMAMSISKEREALAMSITKEQEALAMRIRKEQEALGTKDKEGLKKSLFAFTQKMVDKLLEKHRKDKLLYVESFGNTLSTIQSRLDIFEGQLNRFMLYQSMTNNVVNQSITRHNNILH